MSSVINKRIEFFNGLMLVFSFFLACILPFDVFLFSYAVLGPLHYLTELHWLKNKSFFVEKPQVRKFLILAVCVVGLLFIIYLKVALFRANIIYGSIISLFFIFSVFLILISETKYAKFFAVFLLLLIILFSFLKPGLIIMLGLFIPTLIHVYVFTALFMISGYLRSSDITVLFTVILLLSVPFIIAFLPVEDLVFSREKSEEIFNSTGFKIINEQLVLLSGKSISDVSVVLKVQIFIAFAYTYHYLNWFVKTSVIGWAKSLRLKNILFVSAIWILSIALYLYNYQMGLTVLFILSMLHVLAEFPLNALSVRTVFQKLISRK